MERGQTSPIHFLGICDRYRQRQIAMGRFAGDVVSPIIAQDLIGLSWLYTSPIFPLSIDTLYFILLVDCQAISESPGEKYPITIENAEGYNPGKIDIHGEVMGSADGEHHSKYALQGVKIASNSYFPAPGRYHLFLNSNDRKISIGSFLMEHRPAPPLTQSRIEAIRSNPFHWKQVRYVMACNKCSDRYIAYAGVFVNHKVDRVANEKVDRPDHWG